MSLLPAQQHLVMCQNHIPEQAQNVTNHVDNNLIKLILSQTGYPYKFN